MPTRTNSLVASAVVLAVSSASVTAGNNPRFGGPDSVERIIETDRTDKGSFIESRLFEPVEEWLQTLEDRTGFSVGMDYSAVTMQASDTLRGADDTAGAGLVRLYGRWNLTGDQETTSGGLVYKFENRHDYGDPALS